MVVILLLPSTYSANNGCDGGSNDSNESTTSTGETAIPTTANLRARFVIQPATNAPNTATRTAWNASTSTKSKPQEGRTQHEYAEANYQFHSNSSQNYIPGTHDDDQDGDDDDHDDCTWRCYISSPILPPPPLSLSRLPHHPYYVGDYSAWHQQDIKQPTTYNQFNINQLPPPIHPQLPPQINANLKSNQNFTTTSTSDIIRHVTRVNFYDVDTLQVEFEPKDDDNECDTEAITKEEEWITKRKTELTTTRQIETRVKRQVVLEDGKVVEDSGPIVSTNTTEDTDKQESETTEKRDLGIPTEINAKAVDVVDAAGAHKDQAITERNDNEVVVFNNGDGGKVMKKMVPRPADGLVREVNEKRVISHEEVKDYVETENVQHFGDFSDETYVKAVNSGAENLEAVLLSPESKQQLVPLGPRLVANTTKSFKTIDSEDIDKRCLAQEDGTIVTEKKKTTEHEVILDKELPDKDDHSTGSREQIKTVEASQRYYKQRDEQNVDLIADGKVIGTEMRYAAETMQMEKDGSLERPGDWDSLSDRMRKMRRQQQKSLMQQHKEATLLADRKDALTKRPLDFDREEETRKGETMKWLESHFGSESTASNDSRDDDAAIEPTKKSFFNVTIKSNEAQQATTTKTYERKTWEERKNPVINTTPAAAVNKTKYYQGISNWNERKETPHFASKAFRDDLRETIERNRLRKSNGVHVSREELNKSAGRYLVESNEPYVSREDILQQKRQSLSSQFLARNKRASRENINELDKNLASSRNDLRYNKNLQDENKRIYMNGSAIANAATTMKRSDYIDNRAKSYERMSNDSMLRYDERINSPSSKPYIDEPIATTQTLGRPTVPQRRRAIERKLRQQNSASPPIPATVPLNNHQHRNTNGKTPARSRSSTPPNDYSFREDPQPDYLESTDHGISSTSTLTKKQTQRTRFAPTTTTVITARRPSTLHTQTVQTQTTPPSNLSTSTATSHKSSKVGQVIGNSLRKLVNKIRSVSAERKLRMKSKSKSREQSPSPLHDTLDKGANDSGGTTTYQQYNVIDSHIGGQPNSNESEQESIRQAPVHAFRKASNAHEHSIVMNGGTQSQQHQNYKRATSVDPYANETSDVHSPRQRYYLGEDPYSSTLYGQENLYDPNNRNKSQYARSRENLNGNNTNHRSSQPSSTLRYGNENGLRQRNAAPHTLGRYHRGRIAESTPNLHQDYRSIQTLPRKLHESSPQPHYAYHKMTQRSATTLNGQHHTLGHPERRPSIPHGTPLTSHQLSGPAKPARTYAKALNRSKSFNVHGMNGSNDPSPIYIEKLTRNNYTNSNLKQSQAYKSNPMLHSGLKSPSIVNLISRSQKDLTKIGTKDDNTDSDLNVDKAPYAPANYISPMHSSGGVNKVRLERDEKRQIFLKELQDRAPDLYKTLEGGGGSSHYTHSKAPVKYHLHAQRSLDSRSPIEINKDTASILRRGSSSNEDYVPVASYNRKGFGSTIVEVRK